MAAAKVAVAERCRRVLGIASLLVVPLACGPASDDAALPADGPSAAERQRTLSFWRLYRQATGHRVHGAADLALAAYDSALVLDPGHGDALYYSGNAAFELGLYERAETAWRRLLDVDRTNARAHNQLGMLYSCGIEGAPLDLELARRELERALDLNRAETGPQVRLGEIALLAGDDERARRHLEAVRATNARSVGAHYLAGYLAWRSGDGSAARTSLEQALTAAGGGSPEHSASSEGQTRRGNRPLLESGHAGPLAAHWQDLDRLPVPLTVAAAAAEYERLHRAVQRTRERLPPGGD